MTAAPSRSPRRQSAKKAFSGSGDITVSEGIERLEASRPYHYRRTPQGWEMSPGFPDGPWRAIRVGATAGHATSCQSFTVPETDAGQYRIKKVLEVRGVHRSSGRTAYAYFKVNSSARRGWDAAEPVRTKPNGEVAHTRYTITAGRCFSKGPTVYRFAGRERIRRISDWPCYRACIWDPGRRSQEPMLRQSLQCHGAVN